MGGDDLHACARAVAAAGGFPTDEAGLRALGLRDLRVRHHGDVARVELLPEDLPRAVAEPLRSAVVAAVRAAGFRFVTVDLSGIQSGAFTLPLVTR